MELSGKKVLVYGTGKSGIGAADLLAGCGAVPVLFDEKTTLSADEIRNKTTAPDAVEVVLGDIPEEILAELAFVVMSPGVPVDTERVEGFRRRGLRVIGEIELAWETGKGTVLAITGTNGKTTTTALLGAIMKAHEPETFVVGNIGNPYTSAALSTTERSMTVAEISSFQLETIDTFRPLVSAILNITEDHLNRHHTMEEYIRVKELITKNQDQDCTCVLNYEDEVLRAFGNSSCPARVFWFSSKEELADGIFLRGSEIVMNRDGRTVVFCDVSELKLIGVHNYENVMAACAMAYSAGVAVETIQRVIKNFSPVEHRIEYVDEKNGVIWYNDSKGTNPDAAIKGIEAMSRPTFLIAGGYDKGSDYHEWIRAFNGRVKKLVLEAATREDIRKAALECGFPEEDIVMCETMREAMEYCSAHAEAGDAVLLSPACASWGEFPNYEVRGEVFKEYVRKEI
ncbi:MAG: UDP-N-acetylmuramoyl-L-alanine--D-glutamate ligase [Lachnospiraceae bacterium]|nr:UDP-N-acetylmuramoyl-L-alanine--D-glutamate ligase [Lachnospiraceae bacterium]